jgi:hypothetical protein
LERTGRSPDVGDGGNRSHDMEEATHEPRVGAEAKGRVVDGSRKRASRTVEGTGG